MITIRTSHGVFRGRSVESSLRSHFGPRARLATEADIVAPSANGQQIVRPVTFPSYPGQVEVLGQLLAVDEVSK